MRTIIPEEEVKQFIILFVNRHDRFPTTREIRDHFGSGGLNRYSEISKEVKERYFVQAEQFKNETHKECHQIKLLLELIEEKLTKLQMLKSCFIQEYSLPMLCGTNRKSLTVDRNSFSKGVS